MSSLCIICKHDDVVHARSLANNAQFCAECLAEESIQAGSIALLTKQFIHKFAKDNLDYVENLAKEKNLI